MDAKEFVDRLVNLRNLGTEIAEQAQLLIEDAPMQGVRVEEYNTLLRMASYARHKGLVQEAADAFVFGTNQDSDSSMVAAAPVKSKFVLGASSL